MVKNSSSSSMTAMVLPFLVRSGRGGREGMLRRSGGGRGGDHHQARRRRRPAVDNI
jgi:hypothetical protein